MNTIVRSLALLLIGSHLSSSALAATIIPCGTTEPELLLSKFSFNSATDFAEVTVINDGNGGNGTTLNGWKLSTIDSSLKSFSNIPIRTGETYTFDDIGNLTSTTDQLVLTNERGEIRDAVCWTSTTPTTQEQIDFTKLADQWEKNSTSCISSTSLEKETSFERSQGQDTNQASDWKKAPPEISATTQTPETVPTPETSDTTTDSIATNEVMINELFPDPDGSDDNAEWIELKNTSDHAVSLRDWKLDDEEGGSRPYTFKDETIGAESFLLMSNAVTHLTLNNTKDTARLISPTGSPTSSYAYPKVETGNSWARMKDGTWILANNPTPGEENNSPVKEDEPDAADIQTTAAPSDTDAIAESSVAISEIFPNPTGTDKGGEWIEIHNNTTTDLDLSGWKILNSAGKTFTFPEGTSLAKEGYLILTDQITKISLKNSGDQVQVLDPDGNIQDTRTFESAPENVSFAKISTVGFQEDDTSPEQISHIMNFIRWVGAIPTAQAASQEESTWEWTDMITKGSPNPTYYKIKGIITKEPGEDHTFTIELTGKNIVVQFDPEKIHPDILKAALSKGANVEITTTEKGGTHMLESYKTLDTPNTETSSKIPITVMTSLLILLGGAATFIYLRRDTLFKKDPSTHPHDPDSLTLDDTLAHKSRQAPSAWSEPVDQIRLLESPKQ